MKLEGPVRTWSYTGSYGHESPEPDSKLEGKNPGRRTVSHLSLKEASFQAWRTTFLPLGRNPFHFYEMTILTGGDVGVESMCWLHITGTGWGLRFCYWSVNHSEGACRYFNNDLVDYDWLLENPKLHPPLKGGPTGLGRRKWERGKPW